MINGDFSTLAALRSDGRKSNELRDCKIELGVDEKSDGSCLYSEGLTQVLCVVRGPYQKQNSNDDLLRIQYTVAPFSSVERRTAKFDREFSEFAENIRKSFEGVIVGQPYSKSQLQITVSVLVNGGSAKSCVLNAITLALVHAGVQMRDLLVSCTVGNLGNIHVIDPTDEEEYDLTNETIVSYLQNEQKIDCLELRKAKIKQEHVKQLYQMAVFGCEILNRRFRGVLLEYCRKKMVIL